MDDALLQALPAIVMIGGVMSAVVTGIVYSRKTFRATWRGHEIVVKNYVTKEELYIDGRLEAVSHKGQRSPMHASLTGAIHHGDARVPVLVSINAGITVGAEVYVEGVAVPVAAQRIPLFGGQRVREAPAPAPDLAQDGRWRAATSILAAIRGSKSAADAALMALCDRCEQQLAQALRKLGALDATRVAHAALPAADNATAELDHIRAGLEAEVTRLLAGIQRLHIATLRDGTEAEAAAVREVLTAITAETEVAQVGEEPARQPVRKTLA